MHQLRMSPFKPFCGWTSSLPIEIFFFTSSLPRNSLPPPSYLPPPTYHLPSPTPPPTSTLLPTTYQPHPPLTPSPELQRPRAAVERELERLELDQLELERDPRTHEKVRCLRFFFIFFVCFVWRRLEKSFFLVAYLLVAECFAVPLSCGFHVSSLLAFFAAWDFPVPVLQSVLQNLIQWMLAYRLFALALLHNLRSVFPLVSSCWSPQQGPFWLAPSFFVFFLLNGSRKCEASNMFFHPFEFWLNKIFFRNVNSLFKHLMWSFQNGLLVPLFLNIQRVHIPSCFLLSFLKLLLQFFKLYLATFVLLFGFLQFDSQSLHLPFKFLTFISSIVL